MNAENYSAPSVFKTADTDIERLDVPASKTGVSTVLNAAFAPIALAANTAPSGAKSNELKFSFSIRRASGRQFHCYCDGFSFLFKASITSFES